MSEQTNNEESCESGEDKSPGIFSWRELITQDAEASKKFYTDLLGWNIESVDMGGGMTYEMFMQGERPVAGVMQNPKEDCDKTAWISYITVEDLEATVAKAESLGAKPCMPITEIPGKGRFAGFADPQGAPIAFWEFAE